jgi:hypothetical protein
LKALDRVANYLESRVAHCPEITDGTVFVVNAVSCANTLIGIGQIEEGAVGYLFVLYLRPLTPKAKCSPLFVIENESGMADDHILAIARSGIASDGDPSHNNRRYIFMDFWKTIYQQWR